MTSQKLLNWLIFLAVLSVAIYLIYRFEKKARDTDANLSVIEQRNDTLISQVAKRNVRIEFLGAVVEDYKDTVQLLRMADRDLKNKYESIIRKKDKALTDALSVPSDSAYNYLQATHPDDKDKQYRFSDKQVKSMYVTEVQSIHKDAMIVALGERIIVKNHLITQLDSIVKNDSVIIDRLNENAFSYLETIENKNTEVRIWQKRARGKRVWIGATIVSSIIAVAAIL